MNHTVDQVIKKFIEAKTVLREFADRDKAINYLVHETQLSKEECSAAYDIIMKIEE